MSVVVKSLIMSCNRGLSLCLSSYGRVYAADPYAAALAAAPAAAAAYGVGAMVSHASACLTRSQFFACRFLTEICFSQATLYRGGYSRFSPY